MINLDAIENSLPEDRSRTHWEGCYTEWDHRACAIVRLLALARAGRKMYEAGQSMLDATVEGNIKLGHQKELDSALAAWRGADGG